MIIFWWRVRYCIARVTQPFSFLISSSEILNRAFPVLVHWREEPRIIATATATATATAMAMAMATSLCYRSCVAAIKERARRLQDDVLRCLLEVAKRYGLADCHRVRARHSLYARQFSECFKSCDVMMLSSNNVRPRQPLRTSSPDQ